MKRNRFGLNLDEGLPLVTPEDFDLLYVDCFGEVETRFAEWLKKGGAPLLIGGQIGSGKSTLIEKQLCEKKPDIRLAYDKDGINLDAGDFLAITLTGFVSTALNEKIDLSFSKLPQELAGLAENDWQSLLEHLSPKTFSIESFKRKNGLRRKMVESAAYEEYISKVIIEIGKQIEKKLKRPLFIFASGIDKYNWDSTAFIQLQEIIQVLSGFKILYEVNAAHLFYQQGVMPSIERLFIPTMSFENIKNIMRKRLGIYAKSTEKELELLANWSGGNPRQAIRLLEAYLTDKRESKKNNLEKIVFAVRKITGDYFAYALRPAEELIRTIDKDRNLLSSLISLPSDKETARRALQGNWVFITGLPEGDYWPVTVNPLVRPFFDRATANATSPEIKLLNEYAALKGISPVGLGVNLLNANEYDGDAKAAESTLEKSGDQLLMEFFAAGLEEPVHTNIGELLDLLRAALFSKDRSDRSIIAYKNKEVCEAVRNYLFAKANTYEFQTCEHFTLTGDEDRNPAQQIKAILNSDAEIISIEFAGAWGGTQLEALDKLRDCFLEREMLWWIPVDDLKRYLSYWTHLRQLFEVYILEDELDAGLTAEDVQQLLHKPAGTESYIMWSHDVDDGYFAFPNRKVLSAVDNRSGDRGRAVHEFTRDDLVSVIDGLILHPAVHMHVMSPIDSHEIRIGSGIGNPFLYLFNLRFQLCPIQEKRAAEKDRLVEIFTDAIRSNEKITAHDLMAQPRL